MQALAEQGGVRKGALMSPLGRLLMLVDYLGKVETLVKQGLFEDGDPALFAGLPENAGEAYALLAGAGSA